MSTKYQIFNHCLVDTEKPDVNIRTESWLSPDIKDNEIFPTDYTSFRADRQTTTKRSGGVFVLVKNSLVCTEQPQFRADCEIIWIKPKEGDLDNIEQLRNSLDVLTDKKGTIMVLGDSNLPKLTWIDEEPSLRQGCACGLVYDSFTDILDDFMKPYPNGYPAHTT